MKEIVIKIIAKVANVDESDISESTPLYSSLFKNNPDCLDFDFIDEIRTIGYLEREFDIELPGDFLDDVITVDDVIDKLKKTIQM